MLLPLLSAAVLLSVNITELAQEARAQPPAPGPGDSRLAVLAWPEPRSDTLRGACCSAAA